MTTQLNNGPSKEQINHQTCNRRNSFTFKKKGRKQSISDKLWKTVVCFNNWLTHVFYLSGANESINLFSVWKGRGGV